MPKNDMRAILILAFIIAISTSCEKNVSERPTLPTIVIEARELLAADPRNLTLFCKTVRDYNCSNYLINAELNSSPSAYNITFTGISETNFCLTSIGPATQVIALGKMSNGKFAIELNNSSLKNKGTLSITEAEIELIVTSSNGIEIVRDVTNRVRPKTYWGTIGYSEEASEDLVEKFLQKLVDMGVQFNKQKPGHYFYYEVDSDGEIITVVKDSGYYFVKAFVFQYDGDEAQFKKNLKELSLSFNNKLSINTNTYKGESINSWTK